MITAALRAPAAIYVGRGYRSLLPRLAGGFGPRVLLCTDQRMSSTAPWADLLADFSKAGLTVRICDRILPDVPEGLVRTCVKENAAFDPAVIVGIGGGSCLDFAKIVATLLRHGGQCADFYGPFKVPGPVLPMIAVPTTAGTGSEATPIAVLKDEASGAKVAILSPHIIPRVAVCDPYFTDECPAGLTATTGADALTHAIEAFCARPAALSVDGALDRIFFGKNPLSDTNALRAIELISTNLPRVVQDPADRDARDAMMLGSLLAGLAFGTAGTAAAHALEYPIGKTTGSAHGLGVATLLPYVMEYNRPCCLAELGEIARVMGIGDDLPPEARAIAAIDAIAELLQTAGIPRTLLTLGFPDAEIRSAAEQAATAKRLMDNNPRVLDVLALEAILRSAVAGDRLPLRTYA